MKSYSSFLFLILFAYSCSNPENTPSILGQWHDLSDYPTKVIKNGVSNDVTYPNIYYNFFQDGKYTVMGEISNGVVADGVFELSNNDLNVKFITNLSQQDSIRGVVRKFEWKILQLEDDYLKVNYNYYSTLPGVLLPIEFTILREFERVK